MGAVQAIPNLTECTITQRDDFGHGKESRSTSLLDRILLSKIIKSWRYVFNAKIYNSFLLIVLSINFLNNSSAFADDGSNDQQTLSKDPPIELTVFEEHQGILVSHGSSYQALNKEKENNEKSYTIKQMGKQQEHTLYEVVDGGIFLTIWC
ncbi:hypothetical protein ACQKLN_25035 [Paenibacillus glucanolyticus]|uniref:hypothetical protein n=1 Tax=Paenibacillus glucanolyticus TaxID=59843 RepID=UPI0036BECBC4